MATTTKQVKHKGGRRTGGVKALPFFNGQKGCWYYTQNLRGTRKAIRLVDQHGNPITDPNNRTAADTAHRRLLDHIASLPVVEPGAPTVRDFAIEFLQTCEKENRKPTYEIRKKMLFDLCEGFTLADLDKIKKAGGKVPAKIAGRRIHSGLGSKPAALLTIEDVENWLDAHANWGQSSRRQAIESCHRMFNWQVKRPRNVRQITFNPLKGLKKPTAVKRVTGITDEQFDAMLAEAQSSTLTAEFAVALQVLFKLGLRPSEFAKMTAAHVREIQDKKGIPRLLITYEPHESKNHKLRQIAVNESVEHLFRAALQKHKTGYLFRGHRGKPYVPASMKRTFARIRERVNAAGKLQVPSGTSPYSLRHAYAHRRIAAGVTCEILCQLLGNSRDVCWGTYSQHYAKFTGVPDVGFLSF